ncbi:MAG TPA: aspartate aminotransferase family protein [Gemmatimonadaceae bacterium]|nr:aspartate aminotransferase family protein [Gemmatimonadaceae bacterium]
MRSSPLDLPPERFRALGHDLVDQMAELLEQMPTGPVRQGAGLTDVREALGRGSVPREGIEPGALLDETVELLRGHSLYNGHPRFFGFITSSAAPIGALAELIAATINQNVGGYSLSPMATEIEAQTVRWIAELVGMPKGSSGVLVSGGNMANIAGVWAARAHMLGGDVRARGIRDLPPLRIYASAATHTWIQKSADLSGIGTDAIRWIAIDDEERIRPDALREAIARDLAAGDRPMVIVGTAGSVSTGAIDPLGELASIAREHDIWFHVDGAYGAPAAMLPDAPHDLTALSRADSVAVDPHKWLYAPIEAGCILVRDPQLLRDAFSYHPPYYPDAIEDPDPPLYYHEWSPQNTRGFRALKIWLGLRQVGRSGYEQMIAEDIRLAKRMYEMAEAQEELEATSVGLSICTFRYVGKGYGLSGMTSQDELNALNKSIMERLQAEGRAFLTNAVINGDFLLRACIVNFRTGEEDVRALIEEVVRVGRDLIGKEEYETRHARER